MSQPSPRFTLAVHGGAGTITRENLTPEMEQQYRATLRQALMAGHTVLQRGGSALDAVEATVQVFEDDPLFNAGKGSVFTADGQIEMDAAVMDGHTGQAGAVAAVTRVKNPVSAARRVMTHTNHVLLAGPGADRFAAEQGLTMAPPSYFHTEHRWQQLQKAKASQQVQLDHDGQARAGTWSIDHKYGTVGAVAMDRQGHLAAATSTGGMTNKMVGRIGDSPIIGAGTYADDATVAVSCTGTGEFFMRGLVAYDIAARMRYGGLGLADAVAQTMDSAMTSRDGKGGLIAVDANGNVQLVFNTEGMYRGVVQADGEPQVWIYREAASA
jgi:beta-aspartyl-peptidase (threonine type)